MTLIDPTRYVSVGKSKTLHIARVGEAGTMCSRKYEPRPWEGKPSIMCSRCWVDLAFDTSLPPALGRTNVDRARQEFRDKAATSRGETT